MGKQPLYVDRPIQNTPKYTVDPKKVHYIISVYTSKDADADSGNRGIHARIHGRNGSTVMLPLDNAAADRAKEFGKQNAPEMGLTGEKFPLFVRHSNKFEKGNCDSFLFEANNEDVDDVGDPLAIDIAIGGPNGSNGKSVDGWKYDAVIVQRWVDGKSDAFFPAGKPFDDQDFNQHAPDQHISMFTHAAWMDDKLGKTFRFVWDDELRNLEPVVGSSPSIVFRTWAILDNRDGIAKDKNGQPVPDESFDVSKTFSLNLEQLHNSLKKTHNEVEVSISTSEEFAGSKFGESVKATTSTDTEKQAQKEAQAQFTSTFKQTISVAAGFLKMVEIVFTSTNMTKSWKIQDTTISNIVPQTLGVSDVVKTFEKGAKIPDDLAIILKDSGVTP